MFGEGMSFFSVVSCPSYLWCPKWWRRLDDLFDFLGYLPQRMDLRQIMMRKDGFN
jgi:hypothetical protein